MKTQRVTFGTSFLHYTMKKSSAVTRLFFKDTLVAPQTLVVLICFNIVLFLENSSSFFFENCANWNASLNFRDVPRIPRYARNLLFLKELIRNQIMLFYHFVRKARRKLSWRTSYVVLSKKLGFKEKCSRACRWVRYNVMSLNYPLIRELCKMKTYWNFRNVPRTSHYATTWRLDRIVLEGHFGCTSNSSCFNLF